MSMTTSWDIEHELSGAGYRELTTIHWKAVKDFISFEPELSLGMAEECEDNP